MRPSNGDVGSSRPRWIALAVNSVQSIVGVVCGWFSGLLAFLVLLACLRKVGVEPATRDLLAGGGLIMGTLLSVTGAAVIVRRYRRAWLPLAIGVAAGLVLLTAFAVVVAIPFGASLRNFD